MDPFRKILVPTDFGEAADGAVDLAITIASRFDSLITLYHAYTLPIAPYVEGLAWPVQDFENAARSALDDAALRARKKYARVDSALAFGGAGALIVEHAREHGYDLIVMGTHGRRGVARFLLGSVAERVVRTSGVPVLTVSA